MITNGITAAVAYSRIFEFEPVTISSSLVFDVRGLAQYSIITDSGCLVQVSRVDSLQAVTPNTGSANAFNVTSGSLSTTIVDWPYVMITPTSGTCRFAGL